MRMQKQIYPTANQGGKVPRWFPTNRFLSTLVIKSRLCLTWLRTSEPVLVPTFSHDVPGIRQRHIRSPFYGTQPQAFQSLYGVKEYIY